MKNIKFPAKKQAENRAVAVFPPAQPKPENTRRHAGRRA
jgi:hypothetical protein